MSTAILSFPPGLGFPVVRTPVWQTQIQENLSNKEFRLAYSTYPRYQWDVSVNLLRSDAAIHEYQNLLGFYNARRGSFDTFLYLDADDNAVSGQQVALGDGSTLAFQLVRSFGGFVEPVFAPNAVSKVYVDGVDQAGNWSVGNWGTSTPGVVAFSAGHAPASGKAITADFTYYWPCRFVDDSVSFSMFMSKFYELRKLSWKSVKN